MKKTIVCAWAAVALAAGLAGCASPSMIRTVDRMTDAPDDWQGDRMAYLGEYALPRSRFTVSVSAAGGASASPAAAAASANAVTNTITVNGTVVDVNKPEAGGKTTPSDMATWCRGHRDAYNGRQRVIADARIAWDGLRLLAPSSASLTPAEKTRWRRDLLAYATTFEAAQAAYATSVAAARPIAQYCPQAIKVQIVETIERDPGRVIALYAAQDDIASDNLSLSLDASGFVSGLTGKSSDRSLETAVNLAKTLTTAFTLFSPEAIVPPDLGVAGDECEPTGSATDRAARARARLATDRVVTPGVVTCVLQLLAPDAALPEIDVALPWEGSMTIDALAADDRTVSQTFAFTGIEALGLSGVLSCAAGRQPQGAAEAGPLGLAVSTPTPCELVVKRADRDLARANTLALDSNRLSVLPVSRTALVTQTSAYAFANGRQTSASWDRPSPLEVVVTAPLRVVGAVTETLASAVTGETGRIQARTAQIEAETARITALASLEKARTEGRQPAETE